MDDNDMDLGLLLTAWENDTHIIDETLRSMAIHEEVLREVNRDLLRDLQKCRNRAEMMRVYYLWSIYYEGVMNGLPHRVTSARLQLQVLTRGQYLLEKHFIAQQYVEGWEQFCQWLTACSQRVAEQAADGSAKHTKAKGTSTTADTSAHKQDTTKNTGDKPTSAKTTDGTSIAKSTTDKQDTGAEPPTWSMSCLFDGTEDRISAPEPDFSLLDKDNEGDHLRKFVEPADFGKFDVADAFMPDAADFEDIDSPEEQRKLESEEEDLVKQRNIKVEPGFFHFKDLLQWFRGFDAYSPAGDFEDIDSPEELKKLQDEQAFVEKQANRRVDPGFFQFKDLWQWFRLFDAYNPVGDFDYIDDVVERGRLGHKATKPREQNNANVDQFVESQLPDVDNGAFEGSHPLDWLLANEPCRECIQLFRNSGPMVMSHESEYGDTSSMKAGYIYEEITDAAELLSRTDEWKTSKLEFCGFMGDDMSACIKAVRAAYTRLVAFAERNRGSHNANLIRVFYDGVFSKTKDDTKAKEMTTTKQKITNMVNTLSILMPSAT
ncbi:hypothetical protein BaOVIS_034830 [Babesia ovis]|uniref:Uncharacterized protein n=1 Tax=Babesia ovis TaxID=5869 RepID=A0A9W5TES7_BABOV|nr:hypothetical protein BaOVIS_034830 [Babesia ovis]